CRGTEDGRRRLDRLWFGFDLCFASGPLGRNRLQDPLRSHFLPFPARLCRGYSISELGLYRDLLRLGGTLGLALGGQLATPPELDPQLVGSVGGDRRHRPHTLVPHAFESHDQVLARDSELLREVNDLHTCRQAPLPPPPDFQDRRRALDRGL